TIARYLAALRALTRFLLLEGVLKSDPALALRTPGHRRPLPIHLSEEEVDRLIDAAPGPRDRAILETLYGGGLRVAELVGLDRDDLDLKHGIARVRGKGRKERLAPIGRAAVKSIRAYLSKRPSAADPRPVFLNRQGNRLTARSVRRLIGACALRWATRTSRPRRSTPTFPWSGCERSTKRPIRARRRLRAGRAPAPLRRRRFRRTAHGRSRAGSTHKAPAQEGRQRCHGEGGGRFARLARENARLERPVGRRRL
ncbi:MAG: tyrosine-type recombinase/integrase, partial [Planctomycetota bacterium]